MQIAKHNFYYNLTGASKGKDHKLTQHVMLNELANIIVKSPNAVVSALNEAGVPTSKTAKHGQISSDLAKNLPKNDKLAKNMAKLIMVNNGYTKDTKFSADGDTSNDSTPTPNASPAQSTQAGVPASSVWDKITGVLSQLFRNEVSDLQKQANQQAGKPASQPLPAPQPATTADLNKLIANRGGDVGMSTGTIIMWVAIAAVVIGGLAYISKQKQ